MTEPHKAQLSLPDAATRLTSLIEKSERTLTSTSDALDLRLTLVGEGDLSEVKTVITTQAELSKALRQAVEIERSYHDWKERSSGAMAPGDLDLDDIRYSIRERLDRLRATIGSRGVSERTDG